MHLKGGNNFVTVCVAIFVPTPLGIVNRLSTLRKSHIRNSPEMSSLFPVYQLSTEWYPPGRVVVKRPLNSHWPFAPVCHQETPEGNFPPLTYGNTPKNHSPNAFLFWVINNMLVCRFCFNSANRMATFVLDVDISAVLPLSILTDGWAESGRFGCNLWKSLGEGLSCLRISKAAGESFRCSLESLWDEV